MYYGNTTIFFEKLLSITNNTILFLTMEPFK